jgi:hypothetical protein
LQASPWQHSSAVAASFAAKGYVEATDAAQADFLVGPHLAVHRDLRVDEVGGPRFGRDLRVEHRPVGTLVVEVIGAREPCEVTDRGAFSTTFTSHSLLADAIVRLG